MQELFEGTINVSPYCALAEQRCDGGDNLNLIQMEGTRLNSQRAFVVLTELPPNVDFSLLI